jgi:hypothetical protein
MRLTIRGASSPRISLIALDLKSDISVLANAAMEFLRYVSPYRQEVIRIFGAGYWTRGLRLYEKANKVHK